MESPVFKLEKVVHSRSEEMQDFEGPLDLILFLLGKNKLEIQDISISLICGQYIAWLEDRQRMDLEVASEFVTMAAHLVFIKTRMLLSIHDEEALSEMEQLIASLEEHQRHENFARIKAVIPELSDRYAIGRDYIAKVPEPIPADKSYRYVHQKDDLLRAMTAVLERVDHKMPPPMAAFEGIVGREPYPVADKAGEILRRLVQFGVTRFRTLFQGNRSRSEIVATFIAVLELCRARRLRLAGTASDCTVTCIDGEADRTLEVSTDL
ncbi:MAG: segregation/condensation protein A [Dysosmobacter sp.]|nr:segregation/condensation protein A [Dysosmobacter sp.]